MKKSFMVQLLLMIVISSSCISTTSAQTIITGDSIKSMLVQDWERAKAYTQDYMKAMPADKYSFRATDSVRTFAQQLLHLADANMFLISSGTGEKLAPRDLEKSATAQTADSVLYYVNSSYDFAINSIKKIQAASLMEPVTLNLGRPFTATRLSWLMKAFEHQTHHRGQTTIYIRLAGIRPPAERLF
jgi:uncharacterized damage-inducible protein DinB